MDVSTATQNVDVGIVVSDDKRRRYKFALISGSPGLRAVWACATAREAVASLSRQCPNIVLVSLFLDDVPGTELVKRMRREWRQTQTILLVPKNQFRLAVEALETGASGYLPTPCPADELIRGIWTVQRGGAVLEQPIAKEVVESFRARGSVMDRLTEREREVLLCLSEGLSQCDLVAKLGISKETVRTHVRNVLAKIGARSTSEAIALYLNPRMHALGSDRRMTGETERPVLPVENIFPFPAEPSHSAVV